MHAEVSAINLKETWKTKKEENLRSLFCDGGVGFNWLITLYNIGSLYQPTYPPSYVTGELVSDFQQIFYPPHRPQGRFFN